MSYDIETLTADCYEGTTCLINKFNIRDEKSLAKVEGDITFAQAALGSTVTVPTLDVKVSYDIHEGTQPGDIFKLKGKGVQHLRGRGRGDQYVKVVIEVPKNLSSKQKQIIKEFDENTNDKNYAKRKSFKDKLKGLF